MANSKEAQVNTNDEVAAPVVDDAAEAPPKDDPTAPSATVSSKRQTLSDIFTIVRNTI